MKFDKEVKKMVCSLNDSSLGINQSKAYYKFDIEIVSNRLSERLLLEADSLYKLKSFRELLELVKVLRIDDTISKFYLSGKIHVVESENHEINCLYVYRAIVKCLTFDWDFVAGIDFNVVEVKYFESYGIDVYKERYELLDRNKIDFAYNTYLENKELYDFINKVERLLE